MKVLLAMLLLSFLSVSCGKKNSSGGSKGPESDWSTLADDGFSNSSYQQEQRIASTYLSALKSEFRDHRSKIRKSVGEQNFRLIEQRLSYLQVKTERRVMEEYRSRQVVSSFFDGYTMTIYIGTEERAHSWRFLLKDRSSRTNGMLYNDILKLRNGSNFQYDRFNLSQTNRSYRFEFRVR